MKTITIDVIKGTADVHAVEGDVGVKVIITNTPQEWKNCTVFALLTQGSKSQHIKVVDNTFEIPPAFTDANKAFKFGVYAVGADGSRDVRPSIWIRVADSDFTTEDIEITQQTIDDILMLQAQYTQYKDAEELRQANESARIEAENNRKTELVDIKRRLSDAETDIDNLEDGKVDKVSGYGLAVVRTGTDKNSIVILDEDGNSHVSRYYNIYYIDSSLGKKVDKIEGYQLSQNNFSDNECLKLIGIEDNAQKNVQSDWNTSDTKSDAYIKNKPVIDQTYKSESKNAQSGKAVAEAIAKLVNGSPEALDTLYELAKALGNNPNFAETVMDAIGKKVDKINGYGLVNVDYSFSLDNPEDSIILNIINDGYTEKIEFFSKETSKRLFSNKVDKIPEYGVAKLVGENGHSTIWVVDSESLTESAINVYDTTQITAFLDSKAEKTKVSNQFPDDDIPVPNTEYILGIKGDFVIYLPSTANAGDVVYFSFISDEEPTTLTIDTTYAYDFELIPEPKKAYEIYGKYDGRKWMLGYSEYDVADGDLQ